MKTTIEISENTFRRAKSLAAAQGISLKQLFTEALEEKLRRQARRANGAHPAWMKGFGALADLEKENARILKAVEQEFEQIEPEDRQ
jgi:predicted transcriptional regulator